MKLEIHESLLPFIQRLIKKDRLDPFIDQDRDIIDKLNKTYLDCYEFYPTIKIFEFISYIIISKYYKLKPLNFNVVRDNLELLLNNSSFTNRLIYSNPKSEFFSVIKDIVPYYQKFNINIKKNNKYETIMMYEIIVKFLEKETLGSLEGKELEEECKKRYSIFTNGASEYHARMKSKTFNKIKTYEAGNYVAKNFYSSTCRLLSEYFYNRMVEFYQKTGWIYSEVADDVSFYSFGDIGVLAYDYDSQISLSIDGNRWNNYKFWALLKMQENPNIKIDDKNIRRLINYNKDLIVAPRDFIEEALIKYLMNEYGVSNNTSLITNLLDKMGIPREYLGGNTLLTNDGKTYYVDPRKIEYLKTRGMEVPPIKILKGKSDEERDLYFKKIIATYKGSTNKEKSYVIKNL